MLLLFDLIAFFRCIDLVTYPEHLVSEAVAQAVASAVPFVPWTHLIAPVIRCNHGRIYSKILHQQAIVNQVCIIVFISRVFIK